MKRVTWKQCAQECPKNLIEMGARLYKGFFKPEVK